MQKETESQKETQTLILPASPTDAKESMQTTERDAITSMKVKYMCLDYLYLKKTSFCIFLLSRQFHHAYAFTVL